MVGTAFVLAGCSGPSTPGSSTAPDTTVPKVDGDHSHKPTDHGGVKPDTDEHGLPAKVADDDERKLYMTPKGKYTEADIKANGDVVASAKFKGLKANHNLKSKTGENICPITLTKANPKFSWVIDAKTYEFCCPPCVDEFVALAKDKPDEIKPPEFYRQK